MSRASSPLASVIIPAYKSEATIRRCLDAVGRQSFRDFETIVVDSSPQDLLSELMRREYPAVRFHHHAQRLLPHRARNWGFRVSRGSVIVFTDPDCVPEHDWLKYLMAAMNQGRVAVGGSFRSPPGWWAQSVHVSKFAWWLPGGEPRRISEIPSGNAALTRELFERLNGYRSGWFAGDSELCWRAVERGEQVWFEPRAAVTHIDSADFRCFVRERWRRGKDFGDMRSTLQRWSRPRCLFYLMAAPLLPAVMLARALRHSLLGDNLLLWLSTAPVQLLACAAWCGGEACSHGSAPWRR